MRDFADHPLVETDWLEQHLNAPDLRIVDMRWRGNGSGARLYQAGHLPGAVHLDWQRDLGWTDARGVHDLVLPPDEFAGVMARSGIGDDTRVVAYADADYSGAARLWWALRYYGHDQVAVLNSGWDKWRAEGRPVSTEAPTSAAATVFTPHPRPEWLATADEIAGGVRGEAAKLRLIDTRPREQFEGLALWTPRGSWYFPHGEHQVTTAEGRVLRGGHIPGAAHWHASTMLYPATWTYLPAEQVRARAEALGLLPDDRIVTYCGVGISASLGLFALYLAGFRRLALYDASWEEWGGDHTLPIER
jgi:thiosulfate/3-mercaptopyruvate sulfurtransferase